jgi:hypothetical protein
VLRFFDFIELASASAGATCIIKAVWRILTKSEHRVVVRLLLARPLWWLGARLLSVPDARARYAKFRVKALAKWEDLLLGR